MALVVLGNNLLSADGLIRLSFVLLFGPVWPSGLVDGDLSLTDSSSSCSFW